jgi:hypothetical protein
MLLNQPKASASQQQVQVGAIRWDPWYQPSSSGAREAVEATLSPQKWQSRSPSCATIESRETISFRNCGTQSQIDAEILAACQAKIKYWAYCWYGANHAMQAAWRLHQSSNIKSQVNWCFIAEYERFVREVSLNLQTFVRYLDQINYQRVIVNRPLVYLLKDSTPIPALTTSIALFRMACVRAGIEEPYIVLLVGAAAGAALAVGADAISIYSKPNPAPVARPYSDLAAAQEAYWRVMATTDQSIIPTAMTGADRRPRVERPVPWEAATQKPNVGDNLYYLRGAPFEIATHVGNMVAWIKANRRSCPAQTGLIYSWNEHDEGGSTLNPTLGGGSAILNAVGITLSSSR